MKFTKLQVTVILATIKALRAAGELELHVEQSIDTAQDDMDNLRFLEKLLMAHPKGVHFGLVTEPIKPILKMLISTAALGGATPNTQNAMKVQAFKSGLGMVV